MLEWSPEQVASAAGARLLEPPSVTRGPRTISIDSRDTGPGTLFVGLRGENVDGGAFAAQALANGAWGALTGQAHAMQARRAGEAGVVLAADDPLKAMQALATTWRRHLGAKVVGITGSTGKTSTKDLLNAVIAPHRRTVASRANFNTEIGLPLEILNAPAGTEVLVLEMAMRGVGQIAELAAIAEPDVGVIVTIGPVHLELLGTIEAIAATKAELIGALPPRGTAVVPAGEKLLEPHLRADIRTVTFGEGGDVRLRAATHDHMTIAVGQCAPAVELDVPFTQAHLRENLLAAVAGARAIGVMPGGRVDLVLSPGRGQRTRLPGDVTLIDDCYNANPMSMRAALDDLAVTAADLGARRRIAVLGDMLELGPDEQRFHAEIGEHASRAGVDVLITVGPLAAAMAGAFDGEVHKTAGAAQAAVLTASLLEPGDTVLVKASRGVGLELVCGALQEAEALA